MWQLGRFGWLGVATNGPPGQDVTAAGQQLVVDERAATTSMSQDVFKATELFEVMPQLRWRPTKLFPQLPPCEADFIRRNLLLLGNVLHQPLDLS